MRHRGGRRSYVLSSWRSGSEGYKKDVGPYTALTKGSPCSHILAAVEVGYIMVQVPSQLVLLLVVALQATAQTLTV